jgi:hypothetical protein
MRGGGRATGPWALAAVLLVPGVLPGPGPGDPPPDVEDVSTAAADVQAPVVTCAAPDAAWHAANVALHCTASDAGGLARPRDASFDLRTSVPDGRESATAATGSRAVCDLAGNCATAGPIAGNRVDRKAPEIDVRVPAEGAKYGLFTAQDVGYECLDLGAGVAECKGDQPEGSRLKTGVSTLGPRTFRIVAVDKAGNRRQLDRRYSVEPVVVPAAVPPAEKPPGARPPGRPPGS